MNDEKNPPIFPVVNIFQAKSKRHDFLGLYKSVSFYKFYIAFSNQKIGPMIRSAILFFIIALIAGVTGFGIIAGSVAVIAQTIFFISIVMVLVSLLSSPRPTESIDS